MVLADRRGRRDLRADPDRGLAARLGGLSIVVGYLSLLAIPNAIIVALLLPETRGLSLEAAAMEEAFEKSQ